MNRVFIIASRLILTTMERLVLMILVIFPGVLSGDWGVAFNNQCAIRGTTIVIKCKYNYPSGHFVESVGWSKGQLAFGQNALFSLSKLPPAPSHFMYVGNFMHDCSLKINNVQDTDEGAYYFSFVTSLDKWKSRRPAHLSVKELIALAQPSTVIEGDDVNLTCLSGCPTTVFIVWFKNGQLVQKPLSKVTREDAGMYHCAVLGQEMARSASVALNVQYAPKKVTLSVSPSGNIIKGSSVTFTCSSDANPSVEQSGYSLYRGGQLISAGQSHTISDIEPSHSGLYFCQASNNIRQRGVDVTNSSEVHVDVQYRPMNIVVSVDPQHIVEGSSVNLTCSCAANPAADHYTWYKRTESFSSSSLLQVGSGQVLSLISVEASHTGLYLCQTGNSLGFNNSTEVLLAMNGREYVIQPVPAMVGVGVSLFVMLLIALFLFWMKRNIQPEKETVSDVRLSERGSCSSANQNQFEHVYANIHYFPPPPDTAAQDITSTLQNSDHKYDVSTFYEDTVIYSTVTNKPRNPRLLHHINNSKTPQNCRSKEEDDNSVIYATVAKSC
ncbi:B-cell receptor CD22-like [Channa argus]|uniref:B-cell receptor CD22-like n=1 Tax=Channa argus TaxID=215402 RepID=UPI00351F91EE